MNKNVPEHLNNFKELSFQEKISEESILVQVHDLKYFKLGSQSFMNQVFWYVLYALCKYANWSDFR